MQPSSRQYLLWATYLFIYWSNKESLRKPIGWTVTKYVLVFRVNRLKGSMSQNGPLRFLTSVSSDRGGLTLATRFPCSPVCWIGTAEKETHRERTKRWMEKVRLDFVFPEDNYMASFDVASVFFLFWLCQSPIYSLSCTFPFDFSPPPLYVSVSSLTFRSS